MQQYLVLTHMIRKHNQQEDLAERQNKKNEAQQAQKFKDKIRNTEVSSDPVPNNSPAFLSTCSPRNLNEK